MSTEPNAPAEPSPGMQFDRAEVEKPEGAGPLACAECKTPLMSSYFQVDGKVACEACRYRIEDSYRSGSGFSRFIRASIYGFIAAAAGAGIYYGISALTGYEFGLVAIVVGLMVGFAVRAGSRRRGGWAYQALAMFLTYLAIVSTYIPPIITAIKEEVAKQETAQAGASQGSENKDGASPSVKPGPAESGPDFEHMTGGQKFVASVVAIGFLLAIAFVAPFLAGFENIMGIVIIGIGLYEAWKINKRHTLEITGPHMVGAAPQPVEAGGAGPDA